MRETEHRIRGHPLEIAVRATRFSNLWLSRWRVAALVGDGLDYVGLSEVVARVLLVVRAAKECASRSLVSSLPRHTRVDSAFSSSSFLKAPKRDRVVIQFRYHVLFRPSRGAPSDVFRRQTRFKSTRDQNDFAPRSSALPRHRFVYSTSTSAVPQISRPLNSSWLSKKTPVDPAARKNKRAGE
jgi:hypothetical protein